MPSTLLAACAALSLLYVSHNALLDRFTDENALPDTARYRPLQVLSKPEFPIDDPSRRLIIVGDVHGQFDHLQNLLARLSYDNETDTLFHVGDTITKGHLHGSLDVISFLASNNILGVRGNHDQKVLEWRSWINWISSQPSGKDFLRLARDSWKEAEERGVPLEEWNQRQRKLAAKKAKKSKKSKKSSESTTDEDHINEITAKYWQHVPSDWLLFSDACVVAKDMAEKDYEYLVSLPLRLYVPHAHTFLVHGGLLSHDPEYNYDDPSQPLAQKLEASRTFAMSNKLRDVMNPLTGWLAGLILQKEDGGQPRVHDVMEDMRREKQERGILEMPLNKDPWVTLNIRGIKHGKVTRGQKGKPWSEIWNADMDMCRGFDEDSSTGTTMNRRKLPCLPMSVVYGHAAARGLDIKRWTFGLDTGCVYGGRLTALVLGETHDASDSSNKEDIVPFGDSSQARIVSVACKQES